MLTTGEIDVPSELTNRTVLLADMIDSSRRRSTTCHWSFLLHTIVEWQGRKKDSRRQAQLGSCMRSNAFWRLYNLFDCHSVQ